MRNTLPSQSALKELFGKSVQTPLGLADVRLAVVENAEDEPRDSHGRWASGQDIPTALRPKLKSGLYPKSAELHQAAADPAKLETLFKAVAPKDKGKLTRLMEELRQSTEIRDKPTSQDTAHLPSSSQEVSSADLTAAHMLVKQVVGQANLAKLSDLRKRMEAAGFRKREEQDAALLALLKAGKIGMSGPEGRHKISDEERAGWLRDGGQVYGHVYTRG